MAPILQSLIVVSKIAIANKRDNPLAKNGKGIVVLYIEYIGCGGRDTKSLGAGPIYLNLKYTESIRKRRSPTGAPR